MFFAALAESIKTNKVSAIFFLLAVIVVASQQQTSGCRRTLEDRWPKLKCKSAHDEPNEWAQPPILFVQQQTEWKVIVNFYISSSLCRLHLRKTKFGINLAAGRRLVSAPFRWETTWWNERKRRHIEFRSSLDEPVTKIDSIDSIERRKIDIADSVN